MSQNYYKGFHFSDPIENTASDIRVRACTAYVPQLSHPIKNVYAFAYIINIENLGSLAFRLLRRRWIITNAHRKQWEVSGDGILGPPPVLKAGEKFQYDSWTRIDTPTGKMSGHYSMLELSSGKFSSVMMPIFDLQNPNFIY